MWIWLTQEERRCTKAHHGRRRLPLGNFSPPSSKKCFKQSNGSVTADTIHKALPQCLREGAGKKQARPGSFLSMRWAKFFICASGRDFLYMRRAMFVIYATGNVSYICIGQCADINVYLYIHIFINILKRIFKFQKLL